MSLTRRAVPGGGIITIAPRKSLQKSAARYVLPGTDDQETLNDIIQDIHSNPNASFGNWMVPKIQLLDGDINISGSVHVKDSSYIEGSGYNTRFFLQSGSRCDMLVSDNYDSGIVYFPTLKEFRVDGNHDNNRDQDFWGIKIKSQEFEFCHLIVENCHSGIKLDGEGTYGGYFRDGFVKNNHAKGMVAGGDTTITGTSFGDNAKSEEVLWNWDACGLLINGWNTQVVGNNHFAANRTDIVGNWAAYALIQGNIFEAGLWENIVMQGRAWGYLINNNRFGGRRNTLSDTSRSSIKFKDIDASEKAFGNQICNNSFTVYESGDCGYNYCVEESTNCDNNLITNNTFINGYTQANPVLKVGENTQVSMNII
ncbi:hypothetical protein E4K67_17520 [Desulfosporosinus fructosivorans]|uniref:Right-handed parallel beta-helix repeat-containing protein n=1 Tax=Desulfosporosinus fructosivorans TaxID=2018669 RepID=A0A4Z0R2B4_9FIRM|nr:hypothetical protein [Desulfosporosinus fructosivorans]TGE36898.1 hypothetical protein E4K67_17520 [Desulfosporosinus fructosivorans]